MFVDRKSSALLDFVGGRLIKLIRKSLLETATESMKLLIHDANMNLIETTTNHIIDKVSETCLAQLQASHSKFSNFNI